MAHGLKRHITVRVLESQETGRWWIHAYDMSDGETIMDDCDVAPRGADLQDALDLAATKLLAYLTTLSESQIQLPLAL